MTFRQIRLLTMLLVIGALLSLLSHCTRLSTLELRVYIDTMDGWQGIVAVLHHICHNISSTAIRTIKLEMVLNSARRTSPTSPHLDDAFKAVDVASIHRTVAQSSFDSLLDVQIRIKRVWDAPRLTRDAVLTAMDMELRIHELLRPWAEQGILTVRCTTGLRNDYDFEKVPEAGAGKPEDTDLKVAGKEDINFRPG